MCSKSTVFVVDDHEAVRDSLRWLLESADLAVACFDSTEAFLDAYQGEHPACLVLDVRFPGMGGMELQTELHRRNNDLPVIMISGHGDVPMAVQAMKAGAIDFLSKPFSDQVLLDQVRSALQKDRESQRAQAATDELCKRFSRLTPREKQVMHMVVDGMSNKQIAAELDLKVKTIEAHRAAIMSKTQANSIAQLVRMVIQWKASCNDKDA